MIKKIGFAILAIALVITAYKIYDVNMNYRIREVTENKVYSSGVIPPEKLEKKLSELGIKTVIDLRIDSNLDPLNPSSESKITAEKNAVDKIKDVHYVNIPSGQIPSEKNIKDFLTIMDNQNTYPVLIHCHHGVGRAILYSAIYRIECENYSPNMARKNACFPVIFSNFDKNSNKGKWLLNYDKEYHFSLSE